MFIVHAIFRVFIFLFFAIVRLIVVPLSFLFLYLAQVSSLVSQPGDALLSERSRLQGRDTPATSTSTSTTATTGLVLGEALPPPSLLALARELGPAGLMRGTQVRRARSGCLTQWREEIRYAYDSSSLSLNPLLHLLILLGCLTF